MLSLNERGKIMAESSETIIEVPHDTLLTNILFGNLGDTIDLANQAEVAAAAQAFLLLYVIILVLSAIVYKIGFAKKLPLLKSFIIYILLMIGCIPLAYLAVGLPVAEGLFISAIVLGVYRFRLSQSKKQERRGSTL